MPTTRSSGRSSGRKRKHYVESLRDTDDDDLLIDSDNEDKVNIKLPKKFRARDSHACSAKVVPSEKLDKSYGNSEEENYYSSDDVDIDANHQWGINAVTSSNIATMLSIPDDVESESNSKSFTEKEIVNHLICQCTTYYILRIFFHFNLCLECR